MEFSPEMGSLLISIRKIYDQGELKPFIGFLQNDMRILTELNTKGSVKPSELSLTLGLSRPAITINLKALEEKKFILRKLNPNNKREMIVTITPSGEMYFQMRILRVITLFQSWLDVLGVEKTKHLLEILEISADMSKISDDFMKGI